MCLPNHNETWQKTLQKANYLLNDSTKIDVLINILSTFLSKVLLLEVLLASLPPNRKGKERRKPEDKKEDGAVERKRAKEIKDGGGEK